MVPAALGIQVGNNLAMRADIDQRPASDFKVPVAFFWLVFLAAASLRVTLTSLGSIMEEITRDLHLSSGIASLLLTIPVICMGVCALLAKPLSDRFGLERTITLSLFAIAISTFFRTHFDSKMLLFLSSFVMGTGIAIAGPLVSGYVKRHFKTKSGTGMMLYTLGVSVSGVLGTLSSWIFTRYFGWSWPTALEFWAIPILLISALWSAFYLFKKRLNLPKQEAAVNLPWGNPKAWLLIACFGLQSGLFYTLVAWLLPFLLEKGVPEVHANILLNISIFNGILGGIVIPFMLARFGLKFTIYFASFVVIGLLLLLLGLGSQLPLLYVTIFFLGIFASSGLFAIVMSLPFYEVSSGNAIASWTAMMLFGGYILSAIIPTFFGFLHDFTQSYHSVFIGLLVSALMMLFCFYLFLNMKRDNRVEVH